MRRGDLLLIDEISLAEDSVLERLNSVLDPARLLVLPEKSSELEEVTIYYAPHAVYAHCTMRSVQYAVCVRWCTKCTGRTSR